jgi:aminoglycoside N3'-acetyltransferase
MGTRDDRYDAAHATKDAGRLEEAVRELEAVVIDHPDFALAILRWRPGAPVWSGTTTR